MIKTQKKPNLIKTVGRNIPYSEYVKAQLYWILMYIVTGLILITEHTIMLSTYAVIGNTMMILRILYVAIFAAAYMMLTRRLAMNAYGEKKWALRDGIITPKESSKVTEKWVWMLVIVIIVIIADSFAIWLIQIYTVTLTYDLSALLMLFVFRIFYAINGFIWGGIFEARIFVKAAKSQNKNVQ